MKKKTHIRIIALMLILVMIASTSLSFAKENESSAIKAYTVDYMFDLDKSPEQTVVYYSDDMLNDSSSVFNEHLAIASMGLCLAAGGDADDSISGLLKDMGFEKYASNYTRAVAREDNIAFAYASKKYRGTTIIPVVIRGSHYMTEWYDNFHAGEDGDAEGFSSAANTIVTALNRYIDELGTSKLKIWVTGFSRGAGVADLVCDKLTSRYGKAKVYGYCNEGPMTYYGNGRKANIHHINNVYDGVTCVLPTYMNFGYAGVINAEIGDLSKESKMKVMLKQVVKEDVDSIYVSPGDFAWARIDITDILNLEDFPVKRVSAGDSKEFWSTLLNRLEKVIPNRAKYISVYSDNVTAAAQSLGVEAFSIEDSFRGIAEYIMTMSDSDKELMLGKAGNALVNAVIKLGLCTSNPLLKMIDSTEGNTKLTAKQYAVVAKAFADSMNLDTHMKACIVGGLDPLIALLDIDFANPSNQILGTLLYRDNLNILLFPHGLETTIAWLMSEDSNYTDGTTLEASVSPTAPALKKVKASKNAMTVNWTKVDGATGYEIQYSLNRKFKKAKRVKITKASTTTKKIGKLKANKKYYVRIRSYSTKTLYGVSRTAYSKWGRG